MPASSRAPRLAVACLGIAAAAARADGPAGAEIDAAGQPRLSAAERERLYEQAAREAEFLERQGRQVRRLARLIQPAVVHIEAHKPALRPRDGRASEDETGSGVIAEVAGRTVVLTNRHVIDRAALDTIEIRLDDNREIRPVRLWSDAATDLAVLELEAPDLVPARLAADGSVDIGDTVLAIGSPFGLSRSVTLGIVSALGRRALDIDENAVRFQDFIQFDTPIHPGNSGGPLVNLRGEVVGINTCIASRSGNFEGVGFAIPVGMATFVARQLVERGSVERGYLGIALDKGFSQAEARRLGMARPVGARIEGVTPGSPAAEAGVRPDDVVLEFDGRAVEDDDHLMSLVSMTPVDATVGVVLFRERRRLPLRITVTSRARFTE
ncbi:MAG: S1C family serine protease [Planctomycetaceae bacterium]